MIEDGQSVMNITMLKYHHAKNPVCCELKSRRFPKLKQNSRHQISDRSKSNLNPIRPIKLVPFIFLDKTWTVKTLVMKQLIGRVNISERDQE